MKEEWRSIAGIDGYEVSSHGRARSLPGIIIRSNGASFTRHGRILSLGRCSQTGYLKAHIQSKMYGVHRLVTIAFHGAPPFAGAQTNHKNGIRDDNHFSNLEWMTCSANNKHAFDELGRRVRPRYGADNSRSRAVASICQATGQEMRFPCLSAAAKSGPFANSSVWRACRSGKPYRGHIWRYV